MAEAMIRLRPISVRRASVRIVGLTPLIHHKWSEKAMEMIRQKQAGKKTKEREKRDPEAEFRAAQYRLSDGRPAMPFTQIKSAMCTAAHKDLGIEKTLVRKGLFIQGDEGHLIALETEGAVMREDVVRVGMGSADLRYRPEYETWAATLRFEYDADLLTLEDILNLLERAGFGVGAGEWRPEKEGEFGRFTIDRQSVVSNG